MTIDLNNYPYYAFDDAPIPADEPHCPDPECNSTYVHFQDFVTDPETGDMQEQYVCGVCHKQFTLPLDIPF